MIFPKAFQPQVLIDHENRSVTINQGIIYCNVNGGDGGDPGLGGDPGPGAFHKTCDFKDRSAGPHGTVIGPEGEKRGPTGIEGTFLVEYKDFDNNVADN